MSAEKPEAVTDAGGCDICGGTGEIEACTERKRGLPEVIGCPACIEREQAATIAALRQQVTELKDELDMAQCSWQNLLDKKKAAERELAACREDAERYRWLCDDLSTEEQRDERHRLCMRMGVMGKGAIDAAIKARKV